MSLPRVLVAQARGPADGGAEIALLRTYGHEVDTLETGPADAPLATWSGAGAQAMREAIARFRPAIVHLHGPGGALSPAGVWAAAQCGVPVVVTLHDFGLICVQGRFLRAGRTCQECLGRLPIPAARHACGGTPGRSAVAALALTAHRAAGTWTRKVSCFIAPSAFARAQFIEAGLPASRIHVKPPFTAAPAAAPEPDAAAAPGEDFVYLVPAEPDGSGAVIAAALRLDPELSCLAMGDGPDAAGLAGAPGARRDGTREAAVVSQRLERALALVVPGTTLEPFAQAAVTAFAHGLPVIGGRAGSLPEIVRDGRTGMLTEPGNAAALARSMRWARENPTRLQAMGRAARGEHQKRFSAQENYRLLLAVYHDALATAPL